MEASLATRGYSLEHSGAEPRSEILCQAREEKLDDGVLLGEPRHS